MRLNRINPENFREEPPSRLLSIFLMASFLYYRYNRSVLTDPEYDSLCVLLLKKWDSFEHQHKHLVTKEDLKAGTGFAIIYPKIVTGASLLWLEEHFKEESQRELLVLKSKERVKKICKKYLEENKKGELAISRKGLDRAARALGGLFHELGRPQKRLFKKECMECALQGKQIKGWYDYETANI